MTSTTTGNARARLLGLVLCVCAIPVGATAATEADAKKAEDGAKEESKPDGDKPAEGETAAAGEADGEAAAAEGEGGGEGEQKPDGPSIAHEKYTLDNGLEVLLHRDTRTTFVATSVWYHVGAYDEPKGRSGFAHLFEHLMFQGSVHVPGDKHFAYLEAAGASVRNGMVNGTTNFDRTNYFEVVPMNELELALWLESDRMGWLGDAISQEKLDEQRAVVKNERLQSLENRPYGLAEEKLWHAVFPEDHPYYGEVIGSLADLDAATIDDVRGFYDDYYAPSNATLAIAGNFETDQAKELVNKYFGTLPVWDKPKRREVTPPTISEPIKLEFDEPIGKLAKVFVLYFTPPFFKDGDADMDVLASILATGKSSRLQRALLHDEQIAESVRAYQYSMANVSVFGIEATVRDGVEPEKVLNAIQAQIEFLQDLPPEDAEVERVVNRIETQKLIGLQKIGGFSGKVEQLQTYNHFLGEPDWIAKDLARYRGVTPDTLSAAVAKYLDPGKRAVLVATPKAPAPQGEAKADDAEAKPAGDAEKKEGGQ
jgi:predicted Zn-dependent peptidase